MIKRIAQNYRERGVVAGATRQKVALMATIDEMIDSLRKQRAKIEKSLTPNQKYTRALRARKAATKS